MLTLHAIATAFLTPPGLILLGSVLVWLVMLKRPAAGAFLFTLLMAVLYALSLPVTAHQLMRQLEGDAPRADPNARPQAIVVLGAGRYTDAPEYGGDTLNGFALERVRYAARLHRESRLPVLVSGGGPFDEPVAEAELMQGVLTGEFGVPVRWVEPLSRTSWENARQTSEMLHSAGITQVLLVTHAWHMKRAAWSFARHGFIVTPAATGFDTLSFSDRGITGYLPDAGALRRTAIVLREHIGYCWYKWTAESVEETGGKAGHQAGAGHRP